MTRTEEIAFSGDIARLVADELGISKDKALHHIDFLAHWVKVLAKRPDVLNIYLPHIGYMYINIGRVERDFKYFSSLPEAKLKPSWAKQLNVHRARLDEFNSQFPELMGYNRHKKKSKIMNNWFNKGMSLKELEEWQNK